MDLAALKKLDIKDLLEKIKAGGGTNAFKDKKTLIKFGVIGGAILIFLIIYYAFVSPVIGAQKEKINIMNENQTNIDKYLANIETLQASVKELEPRYKKSSKLFHSKKEVEDLYQNISNFAMTNGLTIINIQKGEPIAVGGNDNTQNEQTENSQDNQEGTQDNQEGTQDNQEGTQVLYYKIPVNYKIQGNYLGYLKFRRALSKSSKVINFDKETITVDAKSGQILSEGTISIVGLPDEYKK
jgi:Tfp pilus assembly protein PilO